METVKQLLMQCPSHISEEQAKAVLENANGDTVHALQELWNIPNAPAPSESEWDARRQTANMASKEFSKLLKGSKSHQHISKQ